MKTAHSLSVAAIRGTKRGHLLSDQSLHRLAAGLFMVGFPKPAADDEVLRLIDAGIGGVILFKRNIESAQQTAGLINALKTRAGRPLIAAVDQEGGRVARLKGAPFTALPPMRAIAQSSDAAAVANRVGRLLAYEVRSAGFDWDFAPVLDVDTNPKNPVIGDRSFHHEAADVARLGVALAQSMEAEGVASCGKHFPGHGDTDQDSHVDLPRLPHSLERLKRIELVPFEAYARAGLASLMTAHVIFEALEKEKPATMSHAVMTGLLREQLGFEGVIVSDDLEMKAIADHYSIERAVVEGLEAGVDLFLVCHLASRQRSAIDAVVTALKSGRLTVERLEQSRARLALLESKFVHGPEMLTGRLGSRQHQVLAEGLSADDFTGIDPTERA